ncbi:hypothetical protein GIB67_028223 [Kingdonia uniflora]|uniref:phospholipase D n=1 Tax=Kingdonia uniflora TaxID=39325 RepID=A0A7J7KZC2_9MAGN|nr:hypothetical protein GIB67_028223 [Kingdonia uniflora]
MASNPNNGDGDVASNAPSNGDSDKVIVLHGDLDLTIIEARSLPNMDLFTENLRRCFIVCQPCRAPFSSPEERVHHRRKIITSDPYVTVCLSGDTVARTRVIPNVQNPKWNEHFKIPLAHSVNNVEFQVKDNDMFGAQLIGIVSISAQKILSGEVISDWFPVIGSSGKSPKPDSALKLEMQFIPCERDPVFKHGIAGDPQHLGVRNTYFPIRIGCSVKLYQDAHVPNGMLPEIKLDDGKVFRQGQCWEDICHAILEAHHLIYITGWSIFHKVRLVREPTRPLPQGGDLTLGELLKYKSQEGVRVLLLAWDDKTSHDKFFIKTAGVMGTHDEETRKFFKHSSVMCVLSPRYASSKLSIFKQQAGGLDLCDGRYDTPEHRLFKDLDTVYQDDYHNPTLAGKKGPRQPWHDLHSRLEGPAAYDVLKNFEQRWRKATKWSEFGQRFKKISHSHDDALIKLERISWILSPSPSIPNNHPILCVSREDDPENWHVQVFRSIDSGSVKGFPKKNVHETEAQIARFHGGIEEIRWSWLGDEIPQRDDGERAECNGHGAWHPCGIGHRAGHALEWYRHATAVACADNRSGMGEQQEKEVMDPRPRLEHTANPLGHRANAKRRRPLRTRGGHESSGGTANSSKTDDGIGIRRGDTRKGDRVGSFITPTRPYRIIQRFGDNAHELDILGTRFKVVNVKLLTQFYGDILSHPVAPSPDVEHVELTDKIDEILDSRLDVAGHAEFSIRWVGRSAENLVCEKDLVIDKSIQTAYIQAIRSAQHFIYIENQYFLGSSYAWPSYKDAGADNLIPMELALKIVDKIRTNERFAVYVVIPMWPEGVPSSASVQEILFWQYQTMQMMYEIIAKELKSTGVENSHPQDYLNFFCLGNREELPKETPTSTSEPSANGETVSASHKSRRFMIYVHAKGMIVDDEYVIVGSANINERSLAGTRDTEIAMGAYQPHHAWGVKKKHPRGQIYGYRMSLWAEHLGTLDHRYEDPQNLDCVKNVIEIAEENWKRFAAEEVIPLCGHLLKYPVQVNEDGKVESIPGQENFPDVGGKILGARTNLPDALTT